MRDYELAGVASDLGDQAVSWQWMHPKHARKRPPKQSNIIKPQMKQQQRRLQNYCAQLVDRHEDELSLALQQGLSAGGKLLPVLLTIYLMQQHLQ